MSDTNFTVTLKPSDLTQQQLVNALMAFQHTLIDTGAFKIRVHENPFCPPDTIILVTHKQTVAVTNIGTDGSTTCLPKCMICGKPSALNPCPNCR